MKPIIWSTVQNSEVKTVHRQAWLKTKEACFVLRLNNIYTSKLMVSRPMERSNEIAYLEI